MTLTLGVLALATLLAAIGILGWVGLLPLNSWAGIRLPSTMMSERAWREAHRVAGPWFTAAGVICALAVFGIVVTHPAATMQTAGWLVIVAGGVPAVIGVLRARRAARRAR